MKKFLFFSVAFLMLGLIACEKDDHNHDNEEELITTVIYTLTSTNGSNVIMTFEDIDGDGGKPPVITTVGNFVSGQTYNGTLSVFNKSVIPADDITEEIREEALAHQFFFDVSGGLVGKLNIVYDDKDAENYPVGLITKLTTSGSGVGKVKITLRHEPNKKASGVTNGNIANAGGETDIEVEFDAEIK